MKPIDGIGKNVNTGAPPNVSRRCQYEGFTSEIQGDIDWHLSISSRGVNIYVHMYVFRKFVYFEDVQILLAIISLDVCYLINS